MYNPVKEIVLLRENHEVIDNFLICPAEDSNPRFKPGSGERQGKPSAVRDCEQSVAMP